MSNPSTHYLSTSAITKSKLEMIANKDNTKNTTLQKRANRHMTRTRTKLARQRGTITRKQRKLHIGHRPTMQPHNKNRYNSTSCRPLAGNGASQHDSLDLDFTPAVGRPRILATWFVATWLHAGRRTATEPHNMIPRFLTSCWPPAGARATHRFIY